MTADGRRPQMRGTKYEIRDTKEGNSSFVALRASLVICFILLVAFAFRVWNLTGIPPGLTHDEANHGREAIGILNGIYLYFFPLNYGSEPLYSYTVALLMAAIGRGLLALRLVNVFFGTAAIAITYAWAAPRLGRATALLATALMAVSFWPLASSREALRVGMLPFFVVLAVWAFWGITNGERSGLVGSSDNKRRRLSFVALFALAIAITFHIYLAARVSWLVFPAFLVYLALFHRALFRRAWRPVVAGLLLAGVLVTPMFLYLRAHPEMQTRLDMLGKPLQEMTARDLGPILLNARDALLAFVWPGFGDQFLAYNIPGRPVLDIISAVLFVLGLAVCLWRWRRPIYAFLPLWFLTGIIPSLITGPTANTTRNMAALPAVYLIVGVGAVAVWHRIENRRPVADTRYEIRDTKRGRGAVGVATVFVLFVAALSGRDYFVRWGQSAEVRGAYQQTLAAALTHVQTHYPDAGPVLFSTVYPGPAHDSSIALVLAPERPALSETARWTDARFALVIPPEETLAVIPYSTPPHPAFVPLLGALETIDLRPTDLDPRFTVYQINDAEARALVQSTALDGPAADFNGAVQLVGARWLQQSARPGETVELLTAWLVGDPAQAGPIVPPTFTTDAVMFTHVLDGAGGTLAQHDALDAPSWAWQTGDLILQIHPMTVPDSAAPGEYPAIVGIYDRTSGARLPVIGGGDTAPAPPLAVVP